jgi:hypothetical protein
MHKVALNLSAVVFSVFSYYIYYCDDFLFQTHAWMGSGVDDDDDDDNNKDSDSNNLPMLRKVT